MAPAARYILVLLVALVALPFAWVALASLWTTLYGGDGAGQLLMAMVANSSHPFNLLFRQLIPAATLMGIPLLWREAPAFAWTAVALALVGMASAVQLWFYTDQIKNVQDLWWGYFSETRPPPGGLESPPSVLIFNEFCQSIFEKFLAFVLVIGGLQFVRRPDSGQT